MTDLVAWQVLSICRVYIRCAHLCSSSIRKRVVAPEKYSHVGTRDHKPPWGLGDLDFGMSDIRTLSACKNTKNIRNQTSLVALLLLLIIIGIIIIITLFKETNQLLLSISYSTRGCTKHRNGTAQKSLDNINSCMTCPFLLSLDSVRGEYGSSCCMPPWRLTWVPKTTGL